MITVISTSHHDEIETQYKETALGFVRDSSWYPQQVNRFFDENWDELLAYKHLKYKDIEMEVR